MRTYGIGRYGVATIIGAGLLGGKARREALGE